MKNKQIKNIFIKDILGLKLKSDYTSYSSKVLWKKYESSASFAAHLSTLFSAQDNVYDFTKICELAFRKAGKYITVGQWLKLTQTYFNGSSSSVAANERHILDILFCDYYLNKLTKRSAQKSDNVVKLQVIELFRLCAQLAFSSNNQNVCDTIGYIGREYAQETLAQEIMQSMNQDDFVLEQQVFLLLKSIIERIPEIDLTFEDTIKLEQFCDCLFNDVSQYKRQLKDLYQILKTMDLFNNIRL